MQGIALHSAKKGQMVKLQLGGRKPYQKGYRFEAKVRDWLKARGFYVQRQHKSRFPDLLALQSNKRESGVQDLLGGPCFIECKVGGKISATERERFKDYERFGNCYVAYPDVRNGLHYIVFKDAFTDEEVLRL